MRDVNPHIELARARGAVLDEAAEPTVDAALIEFANRMAGLMKVRGGSPVAVREIALGMSMGLVNTPRVPTLSTFTDAGNPGRLIGQQRPPGPEVVEWIARVAHADHHLYLGYRQRVDDWCQEMKTVGEGGTLPTLEHTAPAPESEPERPLPPPSAEPPTPWLPRWLTRVAIGLVVALVVIALAAIALAWQPWKSTTSFTHLPAVVSGSGGEVSPHPAR